MTRFVFSCLVALVILGAVAAISVSTTIEKSRDVSVARQHTDELQRRLIQSENSRRDTIDRQVSEIVTLAGLDESKLAHADIQNLAIALEYYERQIESFSSSDQPLDERLHSYLQAGQVAWMLRHYARARDSCQVALKLLETASPDELPEHAEVLSIGVSNSLGTLLALMGDTVGSRELILRSSERCAQQLEAFPDHPKLLHTLAKITANLGVLNIIDGHDGSRELTASAELCQRAIPKDVSSIGDSSLLISELAVGSLYTAGRIAMEAGRLDECRSLWRQTGHELTRLLSIAHLLNERDGRSFATMRYRQRSADLKLDLQEVERLLEVASAHSAISNEGDHVTPSRSHWSWTRLSAGIDQSLIPFDMTIHSRLPGEFEHQDAILFAWPDITFGRRALLKAISEVQQTTQVLIGVKDETVREDLEQTLATEGIPLDRIRILQLPNEQLWIRDFGPLTTVREDGSPLLLDSIYWHPFSLPRIDEDRVPHVLGNVLHEPVCRLSVVLEGGAILSNGAGVLLVSKKVIEWNLEIGLSEEFITKSIKRVTGADTIIYMEPLEGELTGHIDLFVTFTSADTVVVGDSTNTDPLNAAILNRNAERLSQLQANGQPLRVVRIPQPPREKNYFGGSYTNVVYANGTLLVPVWAAAPKRDQQKVIETYQRLLPDWKIVPIESTELGKRGGALHCATANICRLRHFVRETRPAANGT